MTQADKIREAAAAATPGPWKTKDLEVISVIPGTEDNNDIMVSGNPKDFIVISPYATISWQNAAFIAAANPQAVTELLDERDALRARVESLEEALAARELEWPAPNKGPVYASSALASTQPSGDVRERVARAIYEADPVYQEAEYVEHAQVTPGGSVPWDALHNLGEHGLSAEDASYTLADAILAALSATPAQRSETWDPEKVGLIKDDPLFWQKMADYALKRLNEGEHSMTISMVQYEGLLRARARDATLRAKCEAMREALENRRLEWHPFSEAPTDGRKLIVGSIAKFTPYKEPKKQGRKGRWQIRDEYGKWRNIDRTADHFIAGYKPDRRTARDTMEPDQ